MNRRRANGRGTDPRLRRDGRWHCLVSVPARGLEPARRQDVYGKTEAECRGNRDRLLAQITLGLNAAPKGRTLTVKQLGEIFLNDHLTSQVARGRTRESTRVNYAHLWSRHIEPDLGHIPLDQLRPQDINRWLAGTCSALSAHTGKPLSAATQLRIYGCLRAALNVGYKLGLIADNPIDRVDPPRADRPKVVPLENHEIAALLESLRDSPALYTLAVLMILTGARPGEALAASWTDIDLDHATWHISRTLVRERRGGGASTLVFAATKTRESNATIALPQGAVDALRRHRSAQVERQLSAPVWCDPDLVFTTSVGTPLERRNVLRQFKAAAIAAGISRNVRLHDLRHATASDLLAEGVSMELVSKLLRHTTVSVTADVYSHVKAEVRREAADILDRRFKRHYEQS